jgi:hypothetical protein
MKSLLHDSRGVYFKDKRKCYDCNSLIRIDEKYNVVETSTGLILYLCQKCIEWDGLDTKEDER